MASCLFCHVSMVGNSSGRFVFNLCHFVYFVKVHPYIYLIYTYILYPWLIFCGGASWSTESEQWTNDNYIASLQIPTQPSFTFHIPLCRWNCICFQLHLPPLILPYSFGSKMFNVHIFHGLGAKLFQWYCVERKKLRIVNIRNIGGDAKNFRVEGKCVWLLCHPTK